MEHEVAPTLLGTDRKSGSQRPTVGSGEYTYEVFHGWGELPSTIRYGNVHGVQIDTNGLIYIHQSQYRTLGRHSASQGLTDTAGSAGYHNDFAL